MFSGRNTVTPIKEFGNTTPSHSQQYTVLCLTAIGLALLGTGIALIIVGNEFDVQDLLILGSIFLVAGIAFTCLMFFITARTYYENKKRKKISRKKEKRMRENNSGIQIKTEDTEAIIKNGSEPYINDTKRKLDEIDDIRYQKSRPASSKLYGKAIAISHFISDSVPPGTVQVVPQKIMSDNYRITSDNLQANSSPSKDSLYGNKVRFEVDGSPSPPPEPSLSTGSSIHFDQSDIFKDTSRPLDCSVPSEFKYAESKDTTESVHS